MMLEELEGKKWKNPQAKEFEVYPVCDEEPERFLVMISFEITVLFKETTEALITDCLSCGMCDF